MPRAFRAFSTGSRGNPGDRYCLSDAIPFVLVHLSCLAALWTGVRLSDLVLAAGLYALRMFGVTGGYHRYFSHRTYRTSRAFQLVLAVLAQSSAQRGVLWWSANHRHHHRFSDSEDDVHSPVLRSFLHAHLGWIFTERHDKTDFAVVRDLARFPELVWLDRHRYLPAAALGLGVWLIAGWSGLVVGFLWSTVALWHATFAINSLAHVVGRRRYLTADQSCNNWWLALLTFGEGWHNNHHHYQGAACQGFRWYEVDVTYYLLKGLAVLGLVWDLRTPPPQVVRADGNPGLAVVEKAARQLAATFQPEHIVTELRAALADRRTRLDASLDGFHGRLITLGDNVEAARNELVQIADRVHLPAMPTLADLHARAGAMFASTPSLHDVAARARQLLIDAVCRELAKSASAA